MSAGLATLNAGFVALRRRAGIMFWPLVAAYTAIGGLGHGLAMHYMDTTLVFWLYPITAGALLWPVLVDTGLGRASGTVAAALLAALLWWTSWVGWHLAEGARPPGPFPSTAWLDAENGPPPGQGPYDFDTGVGVAAAITFARMPSAEWPDYFFALSETKKLEVPRRRGQRGYDRRFLTPKELREVWLIEPFALWAMLMIAVWPQRAERVLHFGRMLNPRNWRAPRRGS
ncbi:MAG: hypothetical protein AAF698_08315 [Pseudomonadota bacterium]